ncbi:hypothetical protein ABZY93_35300 [Streptomyces smyrnaeus]|uniref:hypothetical protein n=1 Tax=Streptomyces smyrnaeus TaxID=1387713 RepID=UPI0033BCDC20
MTSTHPAPAPARRRRHACLIATATQLVGECAQAAAAVYDPISQAPPDQEEVPVSLWPTHTLLHTGPGRLEAARAQDDTRWPQARDREQHACQASFERRCALIEAETVLLDAAFGFEDSTPDGPAQVPSPPLMAAAGVTDAGLEILEAVDEPDRLFELLEQIRQDGYAPEEVLDDALATVVADACLTLREATGQQDPSRTAEHCLSAARALAQIVTLACIDTGPEPT